MERPKISAEDTAVNEKLGRKEYPAKLAPVLEFLLTEEEKTEEQIEAYKDEELPLSETDTLYKEALEEALVITTALIGAFSKKDYKTVLAFLQYELTIIADSISDAKEELESLDPDITEHEKIIEETRTEIAEETLKQSRIEHLCTLLRPFASTKTS